MSELTTFLLNQSGDCLAGKVSASELKFVAIQRVWCPTPSFHHRIRPYSVPKSINIATQDTEEAGARLTPTPFAIVVECGRQKSLIGVFADAGWHRWNSVAFRAEATGLDIRVDFEGHTAPVKAVRHVQGFVLRGRDGESNLDLLARGLRAAYPQAYAGKASKIPAWWRRPTYCGYGDQVAISLRMEGPGSEAPSLAYCIQGLYERWIRRLEQAEVPIGTVTIDAGWSAGGVWRPNPIQWPNLKNFIQKQHDQGRKVLLWIPTWFTEGLPDEWCIFVGKTKLVANPLHQKYRSFLIEQVQRVLSDERDGFGADGFKIDQLGYTPNERRTLGGEHFCRSFAVPSPHGRIKFSDKAWGCELLYALQKTIYDAAKSAKAEALITSSTVHPIYRDSFDMVRLHDTGRSAGEVLPAMKPRAELSQAVFPDKLIDADNWIPFDYDKWLRYTLSSHQLGVPCLFYSEYFVKAFNSKICTLPIAMSDLRKIGRRWRDLGF